MESRVVVRGIRSGLLLGAAILGIACGGDGAVAPDAADAADAPVGVDPEFNIAGAVAVGRVVSTAGQARSATWIATPSLAAGESTELMKVDSAGQVSSASTAAAMESVFAVKAGVLVQLVGGRTYLAKMDGSQIEIPVSARFVGENDGGDLVFENASVYRVSTGAVETIQTVLLGVRVASLSGNFAVLQATQGVSSAYQIYDTVSTKRYNIQGCNGPGIVALSSTKAYVEDCTTTPIIDMDNGARSALTGVTVFSINGEGLPAVDGAYAVSQTCPGTQEGAYFVCKVSPGGAVSPVLSTTGVQPSGGCLHCGPHESLFGSDNYLVVRELSQVSKIELGTDAKSAVLAGYNVAKVAVANGRVYYLAEDNLGNPVAGIYDLATSTDMRIEGAVKFEELVPLIP